MHESQIDWGFSHLFIFMLLFLIDVFVCPEKASCNKQTARKGKKEKKRKEKKRKGKNSQVSCSCKIIKNTENHTPRERERHTQMQNELIKSCQ